MSEAKSSTAAISRFFQPRKKQCLRNPEHQHETKGKETQISQAIGDANDPVLLLDEDTDDDDATSDNRSDREISEHDMHRIQSSNIGQNTFPVDVTMNKDGTEDVLVDEDPCPATSTDRKSTEIQSNVPTQAASGNEDSTNPFAFFAYNKNSRISSKEATTNPQAAPKWRISNHKVLSNEKDIPKEKKVSSSDKKKKEAFVRMKELSEDEQKRITKKWHSMVVDKTAPIEAKRFQVLVAARLHARCQESTVRKAMKSLSDKLAGSGNSKGGFTVQTIAASDAEVLASCITNLQFFNSKAEQIVKAAKEIKTRFGGIVPEDEHSLLQITGIGKCFADLLAFVNTRKAHWDVDRTCED